MEEDVQHLLNSQDFREYSWSAMLAQAGQHAPERPELDTIGRVKMDYSRRRAPSNSSTSKFNKSGF